MRKQKIKVVDLPSSGSNLILIILSAAFLLGNFAGCVLVSRISGLGSGALSEYFFDYLSALNSGAGLEPDMLSLLWDIFRWPLFVFAFGITPLGLLGIPVLFLMKGFLLSFSVASLFRMFGTYGLLLALSVFGVSGIVCLPAFFVLGIQAFGVSGAMAGRIFGDNRTLPLFQKADIVRYASCFGALCIGLFIEYYFIPNLLVFISGFIQ